MSASPRPVNFAPGDVIEVDENHYRYGTGGRLRLRVEATLQRFPDGWIELQGIELLWNGREGYRRFAAVDPTHVRFIRRAPGSA